MAIEIGCNYRKLLENINERKQQIEKEIINTTAKIKEAEELRDNAQTAAAIVQEVARMTQEQLQYHVSELVSLAMASVFEDPYEFEVEFETKRNQTEVSLWFVREGNRVHPLSASGGGVVDIASFALRVSLWALQNPRSRNTMILDEPFKNLSRKYQAAASKMVKELSDKLDIQFIIVAHPPEMIEASDTVFTVTKNKKGISMVKEESA